MVQEKSTWIGCFNVAVEGHGNQVPVRKIQKGEERGKNGLGYAVYLFAKSVSSFGVNDFSLTSYCLKRTFWSKNYQRLY